MSESICKFMPEKNYSGNIKVINFVYETEHQKMPQPFMRIVFYVHLVTKGYATLKFEGLEYRLSQGDIFFAFPGYYYEVIGDENFKYIYISFTGAASENLISECGINVKNPVFKGPETLCDFWMSSLVRVNSVNANLLSESVLLYTLSFISNCNVEKAPANENLFSLIVDYADSHYKNPDISLKTISNVFSYTEKYISRIFKANMKIGFSAYINDLRIRHAKYLMEKGLFSVAEIADKCGFRDALYFSRVFKKIVGTTPTEYIKNLN